MSEHPIDVDATIKRLDEHRAAIETIKQQMLSYELDPDTAWERIKALGVPEPARYDPNLIPLDCGCASCHGLGSMEPDEQHADWWPCPNPKCPLKQSS